MTAPTGPTGSGPAPAPPAGDAAGRPRVLVADDEAGTLELLTEVLTHAGLDVVPARDGLEALARARAAPPDIALLDVMMPGMDGREVCRRMGADPALTHVPVILHSSADEQDVDWRRCGADAFLQKPFQVREVPGLVRRHLSARVGVEPRARRLGDDEVRALAAEILRAVRTPRRSAARNDVLAADRELAPEDESRVEAALLELLTSRADQAVAGAAEGGGAIEPFPADEDATDEPT